MKTKYIFGLAVSALLAASCSDDTLDKINYNESAPNSAMVSGELAITDAEVSSVYQTIGESFAWYTSSYTEQEFGTGNNQLKNAEVRQRAEMASASTFNNEWNATYSAQANLKDIKEKCQPGGVNEGNDALLAIADILEANNWGILTDLFGDIPCSEATSDIAAPKLDKQEEVYDSIFSLLDEAQTLLNDNPSFSNKLSTQDLLFSGDGSQWLALAHALKARYLLHTYGVNRNVLTEALSEAQQAINGGFLGAQLTFFDGSTLDNSWYAYQQSRFYVASSKTVDDLMVSRNDPRESIYNHNGIDEVYGEEGIGNNEVGVPGDADQAALTETLNYPAWLNHGMYGPYGGSASMHLMSLSETYFIIAECQARLGQDAKEAFENGIKASMWDYFTSVGQISSSTTPISNYMASPDTEVTDYISGLNSLFTANPLNEILVQKYLAQSRDEQIETYNDIRRCNYVDGSYAVTLTNPNNTQNGQNYWPLRLPYGESDVTSNPNVTAAFGNGNDAGSYIFTEPVWWAGGSR